MHAADAILAMAQVPGNRAFAEAWLGWRGDRLVPRRADLDLASIRKMLPMVLMIEVISPTEAPIRVAGTRLREFTGYELTGINYIELAPPQRRDIRGHRTWESACQPCGTHLIYHHRYRSGLVAKAEVLSLPIEPTEGGGKRLMLSHIAPMAFLDRAMDEAASMAVEIGDPFAYVDVGAGVPASDLPDTSLCRVA